MDDHTKVEAAAMSSSASSQSPCLWPTSKFNLGNLSRTDPLNQPPQ